MKTAFDYIIVGAGSAGSPLAARLSEDPSIEVCLLEAGGPDTSVLIHAPLGVAAMLPTKMNNWAFHTVPQKGLNGRKGYQPRGKVLGGSSSTNAMLYVRGNAWDYNHWAELGNEGWSYQDVLPYFKKSEHNERFDDEYHGQQGPLNVSDPSDKSTLNQAFLDACNNHGLATIDDYNGAQQSGAFIYQRTVVNGERCSAAKAYLKPNTHRPNLTIITHALTEKINIEDDQAQGVQCLIKGQRVTLTAKREVIVSAGAFGSPQLLMLSGIGEEAALRQHDITVVKDLPGVGKNLQDHIDYVQTYRISSAEDSFGLSLRGSTRMLSAMREWRAKRSGKVTSTLAESGAFFKTDESLEVPDVQLIWVAAVVDDHARKLHWGHGYSCHITLLRPKSRGELRLSSANPNDSMLIDPKYFDHEDDMKVLIEGTQKMQRILEDTPFDRVRGKMLYHVDLDDTAGLENDIRNRADTQYHPIGTCKMGPSNDPLAVVDSSLRVHGIKNLRVADASIMPTLTGGNTNAPTIMIGEKLADMIAQERAQ